MSREINTSGLAAISKPYRSIIASDHKCHIFTSSASKTHGRGNLWFINSSIKTSLDARFSPTGMRQSAKNASLVQGREHHTDTEKPCNTLVMNNSDRNNDDDKTPLWGATVFWWSES